MSESFVALSWIFGMVLLCAVIGLFAGRNIKMNLEQWTVGGRKFGTLFVWLLMAGEIYTTFAFLGAAGWAYSKGAPTYYILCYGTIAYALSYFLLPPVWRAGKNLGLVSQPDFFVKRYDSRWFGALTAVIGVVFMVPYLQLQLTGLGIIVETASYGGIGRAPAMLIAFACVAVFVFTSGIRGSAWTSAIKDIMMIIAVVFVGFGLPALYHGGVGNVFAKLAAERPEFLVLPGGTANMDVQWFMSTVLLTGCGFFMWPHAFASVYSAKHGDTLKHNAMLMPFYQLSMLLLFFVGFTALLTIPGMKNGDLAFLTLVRQTYPAWFMGFIGAAGAITAMVPASVILIGASTLLAKNVYHTMFNPDASEKSVTLMARGIVIVLTALSLYLAIYVPNMLVNLLLIGYNGVTQFFPAVALGLIWRRVTKAGVFAGVITGIAIVAFLTFNNLDPFLGFNGGFVALVVNSLVTVAVSLATAPPAKRVVDAFFKAIAEENG
ncbi:MAG TPA: sodium:solute symporter family protein [Selenomonadales bacterium]|nr:sodium:solute symporter family protein [Selenomonadales bacterium]